MISSENLSEKLFSDLSLDKNSHYYIAYSGGVDSTVLLHLMEQCSQSHGFKLTALHVNHKLHQDSDKWEDHCASNCDQLGVELKTTSLQLTTNSEQEAREARYLWFRQQMTLGSVLLTAHHQQDRSETLLFNLLRGAGSKGLSSLRELRHDNGIKIVRPLLQVTQEQITSYAESNRLTWIEDPSNCDQKFSRNYIRHKVLPVLNNFRPDAIQNIARAADNLEQEQALMNEVAICDLVEVRELPKHPLDQSHAICYEDLIHLSTARKANLIRFWLNSLKLHTPSKTLLLKLLDTFDSKPSSTTILQEQGTQFRFYQGFMYVMPALEELQPIMTVDWSNISQSVDLYDNKIRVESTDKLRNLVRNEQTSLVRLSSRANVRNPKALQGHTLNLKKWLQEIGIPPWRRQALPLLTMNHSDIDVVLGPVDQQMQSDWVSLDCPI